MTAGYGLACNGSIDVLVERISADDVYSPLALLEDIYRRRVQGVIASVLSSRPTERRAFAGAQCSPRMEVKSGELPGDARSVMPPLMRVAIRDCVSSRMTLDIGGSPCEVMLEFVTPPQLVV
jgi:hypothetical protein